MSSVVPLRSSSCQSPDLVLSRPFPSVLTTMAFDHSRRRWFGTCSCKPVPRGLPSSIKQLHTLGPPRPFALVAHSHRHTAPTWLPPIALGPRVDGTLYRTSADTGWPAAVISLPCGVPFSERLHFSPSPPFSPES